MVDETAVVSEQQRKKKSIGLGWYVVTAVFMYVGSLVALAGIGALLRAMWWALTLAWKL